MFFEIDLSLSTANHLAEWKRYILAPGKKQKEMISQLNTKVNYPKIAMLVLKKRQCKVFNPLIGNS
jgi:hypothetical protein